MDIDFCEGYEASERNIVSRDNSLLALKAVASQAVGTPRLVELGDGGVF